MANDHVHRALAFGAWGVGARGVGARFGVALLCMSGAFVLGLNAASAEVMIPDTPTGRTMSAWLEAFNSGDRTRLDDR